VSCGTIFVRRRPAKTGAHQRLHLHPCLVCVGVHLGLPCARCKSLACLCDCSCVCVCMCVCVASDHKDCVVRLLRVSFIFILVPVACCFWKQCWGTAPLCRLTFRAWSNLQMLTIKSFTVFISSHIKVCPYTCRSYLLEKWRSGRAVWRSFFSRCWSSTRTSWTKSLGRGGATDRCVETLWKRGSCFKRGRKDQGVLFQNDRRNS